MRELLEEFKGLVSEDVARYQESKYDKLPSQQIVSELIPCLL